MEEEEKKYVSYMKGKEVNSEWLKKKKYGKVTEFSNDEFCFLWAVGSLRVKRHRF